MRNIYRWAAVAAVAASLTLACQMEAFAAPENWKQNETGWWYEKEDGTFYKDTWAEEDGAWYHFNKDGYRDTGWLKDKSEWYYLDEEGRMVAGTSKNIDGTGYTFDADGVWIGNTAPGVYPGEWQGNAFVNTWSDYRLTVPDGTKIYLGADLKDIRAQVQGEIQARAMEENNLTELMVELADGSIITIAYQKGEGTELLDQEQMAKAMLLLYSTAGYQIEGVEQSVLGGHTYSRIKLSAYNGLVKTDIYMRKVGDMFMLVQALYVNGYGDAVTAVLGGITPAA